MESLGIYCFNVWYFQDLFHISFRNPSRIFEINSSLKRHLCFFLFFFPFFAQESDVCGRHCFPAAPFCPSSPRCGSQAALAKRGNSRSALTGGHFQPKPAWWKSKACLEKEKEEEKKSPPLQWLMVGGLKRITIVSEWASVCFASLGKESVVEPSPFLSLLRWRDERWWGEQAKEAADGPPARQHHNILLLHEKKGPFNVSSHFFSTLPNKTNNQENTSQKLLNFTSTP